MLSRTSTNEITLPLPLPWQERVRAEARRFNVVVVGRRAGKSTMGYELVIEPAIGGYPTAWFAPTYKLLGDAWREIRRTVAPITRSANASDHRIELTTGGAIEMWTLEDENAGRSRKYKRAIIDEGGLVWNLGDRWNDAIRPTLADYAGDAWFLGTPTGMDFFYTVYQWGQDDTRTDWQSWQMPTTVNPYIKQSEIDDMRRDLPEDAFRQEVLAEFLRSDGAVFRNIKACLHAPLHATPAQHAGHEFVAGLDWAQKQDYTCMSVMCATCRQEVMLDRFNQIGWDLQRGRVQAMNSIWHPYIILAESNSIGSPNIEALVDMDLPVQGFETTAASKPLLIKSFALALERTEGQWLNIPVATAELTAYEAKISPATGRVSYSAPANLHDDTVIARALAWRAASSWGSLA